MVFEWNFAAITRIWWAAYRTFEQGNGMPQVCERPFFVLNGDTGERILHFADGTDLRSGPRELRYVPKGVAYWVEKVTAGDYWTIVFDLEKDVGEKPFSIPVRDYNEMKMLFSAAASLEKDLYDDTRFSHLAVHKYLYEIIIKLLKEQAKQYLPSKKRQQLQPALNAIAAHYCDGTNLSVEALAKLCGIGETYFRKLFMESLSMNPKEYIIYLRMERAKQLLFEDVPIQQISQLCGYAEASSFTREFTNRVGVSPRAFRQTVNYD